MPSAKTSASSLKKVEKLYKLALNLIEKDLHHLKNRAIANKLEKNEASALVAYAKVLEDMYKAHKRIASEAADKKDLATKDLSDDDLKKLVSEDGEVTGRGHLDTRTPQEVAAAVAATDEAMKQHLRDLQAKKYD